MGAANRGLENLISQVDVMTSSEAAEPVYGNHRLDCKYSIC
jgi:hypothetical protein